MSLLSDKFYIILDMDRLTIHDDVVNYKQKIILLQCHNDELINVEAEKFNYSTNIISTILFGPIHWCVHR